MVRTPLLPGWGPSPARAARIELISLLRNRLVVRLRSVRSERHRDCSSTGFPSGGQCLVSTSGVEFCAQKIENGIIPGDGISEGDRLLDRRIGLEQEFFLVEDSGRPSERADEFLERCRAAAGEESGRADCFAPEF